MVTLAPALVLLMVSTMASAATTWGIFGCPDMRKKADSTVAYTSAGKTALQTRMETGGPYRVIAAAESDESRDFSCITITPGATSYATEYYFDGAMKTASLKWSATDGWLTGTLKKNLLNSKSDSATNTYTVVSDKDGLLVVKHCKPDILSHHTATYILADESMIGDVGSLDMDCLLPLLDTEYKVELWPKGVC